MYLSKRSKLKEKLESLESLASKNNFPAGSVQPIIYLHEVRHRPRFYFDNHYYTQFVLEIKTSTRKSTNLLAVLDALENIHTSFRAFSVFRI